MAYIPGTDNDDTLYGTNDPDQILGFGGNDLLVGLNGNDVIQGGNGDDRVAKAMTISGAMPVWTRSSAGQVRTG